MKWLFRFFVLVLLLAGWGLAALSLHVVLAPGNPGRIALIPKKNLAIADTWVDVRKWTVDDLPNHPAIVARMVENGKTDLIGHVVNEKDLAHKFLELVGASANKKPASTGSNELPIRD